VRKGRRALYSPCSLLVQELLLAKRELKLHRLLKRLAAYDILLLDKCGATNNVEPLARNAELVIP
jgi:DNA replication protein DnaC